MKLIPCRKKEYDDMLRTEDEGMYYTMQNICNYKASLALGPGIFIGEN